MRVEGGEVWWIKAQVGEKLSQLLPSLFLQITPGSSWGRGAAVTLNETESFGYYTGLNILTTD